MTEHYNYFRDYDPGIGRYLESDLIGLGGGLSTFGYVSGAPIEAIDLFGLAQCTYSISSHTLSCSPNNPGAGTSSVNLGPGGLFSGLGNCRNNPSGTCQASKNYGPIPEGDYDMLKYDGTHANSNNWWRLRPQSPVRRILDGLGYGRGGHILHPGTVSLGCITYTGNDADYNRVNSLLSRESGKNVLRVTP